MTYIWSTHSISGVTFYAVFTLNTTNFKAATRYQALHSFTTGLYLYITKVGEFGKWYFKSLKIENSGKSSNHGGFNHLPVSYYKKKIFNKFFMWSRASYHLIFICPTSWKWYSDTKWTGNHFWWAIISQLGTRKTTPFVVSEGVSYVKYLHHSPLSASCSVKMEFNYMNNNTFVVHDPNPYTEREPRNNVSRCWYWYDKYFL